MGPLGKIRKPGIVILLSIVTVGIYGLYWQYAEFQELKDHTGTGLGGGIGLLLAVFVGIANVFLLPNEISNMYTSEGQVSPVRAATGWWLLLPLAGGFIWLFKVQGALNRHWASHGAIAA